jgi:hypothetical protein
VWLFRVILIAGLERSRVGGADSIFEAAWPANVGFPPGDFQMRYLTAIFSLIFCMLIAAPPGG